MNRRIKYTLIAALITIAIGGAIYISSIIPIVTGYAAKNLASAVFVSERTQEDVESLDLNFSLIKFAKNKVDYENKTVTSSFLWGKSTAIYRDGYGCSLVHNKTSIDDKLLPEIIPPYDPDTLDWPMGNILPQIDISADLDKLSTIKNDLIDNKKYGGHAFAFVVLHKGVPVMEGYNEGINKDTRLLSWSIAKSFTNALVGIMTKDGLIDVNERTGLKLWEEDVREYITINDLLRMKSGLKWSESYGSRSDVTVMLNIEDDFGEYASEKYLKHNVGEKWYYSSGSTNIINKVMRSKIANDEIYYKYANEQLFNKIGMPNAVFEIDPAGNQVGSSYIYATARDYARFALLYLNNGNFNGEQILPNDWVDYSSSLTTESNGEYGASFWLNLSKTLPSAPDKMFSCHGHDGQRIFILPDNDAAVVVLGYSPKKNSMDFDLLLADVLDALPN